jgi:hypothetical protein
MINKEIRQDLVQLIELYRASKVGDRALEMEFTKAVSEKSFPLTTYVKIVSERDGNDNSTFGVTILPEKVGENLSVTLLVDKDALLNLVEEKDLIDMIFAQSEISQKVLKDHVKFLQTNEELNLGLAENLIYFLNLYKTGLQNILQSMPEVVKDLFEKGLFQNPETIEKEIELIENQPEELEYSIERLVVSKKFPKQYLEAAKSLVQGESKEEEVLSILSYSDEKPAMNQFHQHARTFADGTYDKDKLSKKIPYDYYPKTNQ